MNGLRISAGAIDKQIGLPNIYNLHKQIKHRYSIKDYRLDGL